MEELLSILFEVILFILLIIPGATIRWIFFSLFGGKKSLRDYIFKDDDDMNSLVGFIFLVAIIILIVNI